MDGRGRAGILSGILEGDERNPYVYVCGYNSFSVCGVIGSSVTWIVYHITVSDFRRKAGLIKSYLISF
jgi:hypothetical protein